MSIVARRSIFQRLYNGETAFDFVGPWRRWFLISASVIVIGLVSLGVRGLNLGIDFEGGTAIEVRSDASVGDARDALRPLGLAESKIQIVGGDTIRLQARIEGSGDTPSERAADRERQIAEVESALGELDGTDLDTLSVNDVGPSWGDEITSKAQRALIFFLVAITLYIALRFEWKMAVATLAALFHDILVTVSVYSVTGFEVTPATVIAILTILGYSIYDGIVVFDKIEENTRGLASSGRMTYGEMVNVSLNQVLMRTLNTSITALLPIGSLLVVGSWWLGATTLQEFALALLVGLAASAYSSIFIASPALALLKEREHRYASIRQRIEARGGSGAPLTPAAVAAGGRGGDGGELLRPSGDRGTPAAESRPRPAGPANRPPPRPRKKGKRR